MDPKKRAQITIALERTKSLIDSKILWDAQFRPVFYTSVLIEILIHFDYLLKEAISINKRVSFKDKVKSDSALKINDVTDLIINFRNAYCHIETKRNVVNGSVISNNINIELNSQDHKKVEEISFIMGHHALFLSAHVERAFLELEDAFNQYVVW